MAQEMFLARFFTRVGGVHFFSDATIMAAVVVFLGGTFPIPVANEFFFFCQSEVFGRDASICSL